MQAFNQNLNSKNIRTEYLLIYLSKLGNRYQGLLHIDYYEIMLFF
jgi:hypothetical protein